MGDIVFNMSSHDMRFVGVSYYLSVYNVRFLFDGESYVVDYNHSHLEDRVSVLPIKLAKLFCKV